jgi:hypothetical protein
MHIGVRMSKILNELPSLLKVKDVTFVKSSIASYAVVQAQLVEMPTIEQVQQICNEKLCIAKIAIDSSQAYITFVDEVEDNVKDLPHR